jgi:pilus assembly protein CpaE
MDSSDIRLKVLLVSRRKDVLESLESALRAHPGVRTECRLVVNGHVDPLHDLQSAPDALVLHLGETWRAELDALAERPTDRRPPLIVVGAADAAVMRLAMRAGARDVLPLPLVQADLISALASIERDVRASRYGDEGRLTTFINAKGGCGATLLACNVAHVLAEVSDKRVALIDLDLQFGAIPLYFDSFPKRGVLQALENIEGLDATALEAYMVRHASGLQILGHAADDPLPVQSGSASAVQQLLAVAVRNHDHVIVDLPRRIDAVSQLVLEHSRQIVVVVQQSVSVLRDATRLLNYLQRDLRIAKERIVIVVNRYDKDASIATDDIRNTLGGSELCLVPNDFRVASLCIETGSPMWTTARSAAITKAIMALETRLGGSAGVERQGLLARTFSNFLKPRSP